MTRNEIQAESLSLSVSVLFWHNILQSLHIHSYKERSVSVQSELWREQLYVRHHESISNFDDSTSWKVTTHIVELSKLHSFSRMSTLIVDSIDCLQRFWNIKYCAHQGKFAKFPVAESINFLMSLALSLANSLLHRIMRCWFSVKCQKTRFFAKRSEFFVCFCKLLCTACTP